ncbi:MAG: pyridoxamine 5'-phosphate oxidase [Flavobacteriales bacterium]|nr:pyridoxamine 5'-phosphate oxidase [Flavobacteriales bacterium]
MGQRDLSALRKDYVRSELDMDAIGEDPFGLFHDWFSEAEKADLIEPHAMSLTTVGSFSLATRIVLLRSFDRDGFVFYTNYNSRKAMDLERDPRTALCFFWPELERQVRVEGKAEKTTASESDAYFATRPRESQIGAWSSDQSRPVESRVQLDERYQRWQDRFKEADPIPRPLHWGGYRVRPVRIEFWQGRPNRMHDRIVFEHFGEAGWERLRVQP